MRKFLFSVIGLLALFSVGYFLTASFLKDRPEEAVFGDEEPSDTIVQVFKYGLPVDSFHVVEDVFKPNQFLADILLKHHIPYPEIDNMVRQGKEVFDVRKMRSNRPYAVFCTNDSTQKAQCFIYEINAIDYVVYDLRDSLLVYKAKKPVEVVEKTAAGIINSSLYVTMVNNGLSPLLANSLAEIYAWSIDFYRIQKGDKFKVIYEEQSVDGEVVGIKSIKSAMFEHAGEEYYAIYFEQNGIGGYYDQENRGMRRQFLKAPVKFSRISSRFSPKRFHPVQKRWKAHKGTDYAAPKGTPIMSTANGTVVAATFSKYNGNYVKVKHNGTYTTQYLHMSKIKSGIRRGVKVRQGDVIGYVGSTGLATGPHVCYRFWKNGVQVDALRQKLPKSEPIKNANKAIYEKIRDQEIKELKAIKYPEGGEELSMR